MKKFICVLAMVLLSVSISFATDNYKVYKVEEDDPVAKYGVIGVARYLGIVPKDILEANPWIKSRKKYLLKPGDEIRYIPPTTEVESRLGRTEEKIDNTLKQVQELKEDIGNIPKADNTDRLKSIESQLDEVVKPADLQKLEESFLKKGEIVIGLVLILVLFFCLFILNKKKKEKKPQMWPSDLAEIADMYFGKKDGKETRFCGYCKSPVSGKKYVAHLRRCSGSPLYGFSADKAKEMLKKAQENRDGGEK